MDEYNFYRYIDDKSILVITPKNKLIRIRCPFAVINTENKILQVDAVSEKNNLIYYKIKGSHQIYNEFTIIAK
ncbi:hypothetical protein SAMN05421813_1468 [Daejeonella rubra]|uniref:Uncharacterized protein n=1 Tax=Daejeonella rubra TaxID=990371 RepID=A0A1G9YVX7_9SPHI|nr:hypothetical protein [Daejeonella rubra]SDN13300.1 hypothetical protein SAMN05421813_1468 [Daejeonella rubra]